MWPWKTGTSESLYGTSPMAEKVMGWSKAKLAGGEAASTSKQAAPRKATVGQVLNGAEPGDTGPDGVGEMSAGAATVPEPQPRAGASRSCLLESTRPGEGVCPKGFGGNRSNASIDLANVHRG